MRTKTLLITAALAAAGLVTASAQVFSVNAVGYVNINVPAANVDGSGGYIMLANPLNGNPDNNLNTILPLRDEDLGCTVYRFNPDTQRYYETMVWGGVADGWAAADPGDLVIAPGEGFFLKNINPAGFTITFVGEVPAGNPTVNSVSSLYSIKGAKVPRSGRLGWVGLAGSLEFPADFGDNLYVFNPLTQRYFETYTFEGAPPAGSGWVHDIDPPEGPQLDPGNGILVKSANPQSKSWNMPFSVN